MGSTSLYGKQVVQCWNYTSFTGEITVTTAKTRQKDLVFTYAISVDEKDNVPEQVEREPSWEFIKDVLKKLRGRLRPLYVNGENGGECNRLETAWKYCHLVSVSDDNNWIQAAYAIDSQKPDVDEDDEHSYECWRLEFSKTGQNGEREHYYARHASGDEEEQSLDYEEPVIDAFYAFYHNEEFSDDLTWGVFEPVEWWWL